MSGSAAPELSPAVRAVLQGEYLDLLLVAGRLARREISSTDGNAAATLRAWILRQLKESRQKLDLRHFAGAPAALVEAEIAVVAFLDTAAAGAFGLPVWRLLREDMRNDYIDAGREARSVVDLGKYVYERLERLRRNPDLLGREPDELLEIYDRCWRLGYRFSYDDRPNEFEDIKTKIAEVLRLRDRERHALPTSLSGPLDADPQLSPHLPPLTGAASGPPPLNPWILSGLFAGLLVLMLFGFTLALHNDRSHTEAELRRSRARVEDLFQNVDQVCVPPTAPSAGAMRRRSRRHGRRVQRRS
ncbi:DotU family type IV/VI secretion system protein [Haliangium sp. UPWRP_2]|uniref:DotU family type IV/VI secretion system protein n=1 Tax=Haliangium sp. UPWRP_2 TaxID=1931276 RepID=UPI000B53EE18|nr:DotU family type IV/VI secretion system protein [Haliangium sp. UPWRP_2]PSM32205.1 hypothetical protein BVG81_001465 [Haliangium sp. UPWRP_2]HNN90789.1 DotU family type IV/VI secretion system protein [Pseudomonadota bacterium]